MKNKILAFSLSALLILSMIVIPASAEDVIPNYVTVPNVIAPGSDNYGIVMISSSIAYNNSTKQWTLYVYTTNGGTVVDPVYGAIYQSSNSYCLVCASTRNTDSNGNPLYMRIGMRDISSNGDTSFNQNMLNHALTNTYEGGYFYNSQTLQIGTDVQFSSYVYNSLDDALEGIASGDDGTSNPVSLNYSLPAGNIIFIEVPTNTSNNSFVATSDSALDHSSPWTTSNQKYGLLDSIPQTVNANIEGTTNFVWYGTSSNSVFGTFKNWRSTHDIRSGKYICIINPAYPTDTPENQALNGAINIFVEKALSFKVYQLNAGWTNGSIDNSETGTIYDGTYDDNTGQWSTVDQNGIPSVPVSGGSNAGFSTDGMTVSQWLENIAHQISGFFTGAIGAINTLVAAISNISGTLMSLYIWLPPAVQGILTSAIILAITIGVIKVFI